MADQHLIDAVILKDRLYKRGHVSSAGDVTITVPALNQILKESELCPPLSSCWECYQCGGNVYWGGDVDIEPEDYDGFRIETNYTCSACGALIIVDWFKESEEEVNETIERLKEEEE